MNLKSAVFSLAGLALLQGAWAVESANSEQAKSLGAYTVHELGSVEGGISDARSVSSNGKAAGHVTFNIGGSFRPALFELGRLPTPIYTDGPGKATGVNAGGEVVGWYEQGGLRQAFRWKNHRLATLPGLGGGSSHAAAINNRSEIVGWSEAAPGVTHAAYFYNGRVHDLGRWGGVNAQATALNERGDIVGYREVVIDGVTVRQGVRLVRGQKPVLLRPPKGFDALVPLSINEQGDVAGYLHKAGGLAFETQAFTLIGGHFARLRADRCCGGFPSAANAINSAGQSVGQKFDGNADPRSRGRLWTADGQPVALDVLPEAAASGWHALGESTALNDRGVIVGVGQTDERNVRAYMLVPKK